MKIELFAHNETFPLAAFLNSCSIFFHSAFFRICTRVCPHNNFKISGLLRFIQDMRNEYIDSVCEPATEIQQRRAVTQDNCAHIFVRTIISPSTTFHSCFTAATNRNVSF